MASSAIRRRSVRVGVDKTCGLPPPVAAPLRSAFLSTSRGDPPRYELPTLELVVKRVKLILSNAIIDDGAMGVLDDVRAHAAAVAGSARYVAIQSDVLEQYAA